MPDLLRRSGPKLAVGGLVALNVVLIGALALRSPGPAASAVPAPGPTMSVTASPDPTSSSSARSSGPTRSPASASPFPTPSGSASPTTSPSASSPPSKADRPASSRQVGPVRTRVLAASSDRIAWRAEPSRCGKDATVEVTTDGGRHWTVRHPGIGSVVRLKTYGDRSVFAIGADARCRPTYAWTTGPNEPWRRSRSLVADIWFRQPADLSTVHAPGGKQSQPCGNDLVSLAGLGTYQAAVLCRDGRLRTNAEGRPWRTVATHTGAVSLNADDSGFVAAMRRSGCAGVVVTRFAASGTGLGRSAGRCRKSSVTGPTMVAVCDEATWLWAADQVRHY